MESMLGKGLRQCAQQQQHDSAPAACQSVQQPLLSSTPEQQQQQQQQQPACGRLRRLAAAGPEEARQRLEKLFHLEHPSIVALQQPATLLWALQALRGPGRGSEAAPAVLPMSVQLSEPPPSSRLQDPKNKQRKEDFYANVGDAIRTLREETPVLFQRDLTYGIYRDDIVFKDPRNSFAGKKNYQTIFWSLRFHGRLFFKVLYVEVKRIWQPEQSIIRMRWTVHGIPRVPWEAEGVFDGISQFKLDRDGKIYEHAVDNVILGDPPYLQNPIFAGLNMLPLPGQRVPQAPCPGAFFKDGEPALAKPARIQALALPQPKQQRRRSFKLQQLPASMLGLLQQHYESSSQQRHSALDS